MTERTVSTQRLWLLAVGFGLWGSALLVLYALHTIGCAFVWSAGLLRVALAVALIGHLTVIGWIWRDLATAGPDSVFCQTGAFLHRVALWTVVAAFAVSVVTLGPSLLLTTCI